MRVKAVFAIAVFASLFSAPAGAAPAASITQTGWWSQRPGASAQPDGGFELALAPNEALSIAAIRIDVNAVQLSSALLSITESQAFGSEVAGISACVTTDSWTPANPGAWEDRPTPNCNTSTTLGRRNTGEWSADISSLLTVGTNSIVLVPGSSPDTQGAPVPYQLGFEKPKLLATAPTAPPPDTSGGGSSSSGGSPTIVSAPDTPPTSQSAGPPAVVVAPDPSATPSAEVPFAAAPASGDDDGGVSRPWWRLALLLPIAALAGAAATVARRGVLQRQL